MGSRTVDCRKFTPNIFTKSKCSHCFRQREEHSNAALESNRVTRKVSKCGYLFVAPDWDFTNPLYRTKRWQRRWFVLYDDGELTYAVDDHPETIPQACIDMTKTLEVSTAEEVTGHTNSLAITASERVTFVKGTCPEEAKWWLNILAAFPKTKGRHKRNATFPGGQATTQANRNRHHSYHKVQPPIGGNLETISVSWRNNSPDENNLNGNNEQNINNNNNNSSANNGRVYTDQPMSSKSPPTRDKLYPEGKAQARIRSRNRSNVQAQETTDSACILLEGVRRDEKLKDIVNTITLPTLNQHDNNRWSVPNMPDDIIDEKPTRDENGLKEFPKQLHNRPQSLAISSTAPAIVSAIIKKHPNINKTQIETNNSKNYHNNNSNSSLIQQKYERGDPDGGCNIDEMPVNYINKNSEIRANLSSEDLLNSKKGWLMKQNNESVNEWTKHWFTLRGAALFYYRDPVAEESGVLDGVLDVNSLTSISEIAVVRNFGFQLTTWDNRRIVLSTITASIRNNWINVLKSAAGLQKQQQHLAIITPIPLTTLPSGTTTTTTLTTITPTTVNQNELIKDDHQKIEDVVDNKILASKQLIINNSTDDLKSEIEKDFIKAQKSQEIIVVNKNINNNSCNKNINNNNNKLKCNIKSSQLQTIVTQINTPLTPKSIIFSSDEEYRTASEGGRRDSIDWGSSSISPTSPSPISISSIVRAKDKNRSRSNSNSRLHKRSRSSPPSSRRSTIDSVGSDDLPPVIIRPVVMENDNKLLMVDKKLEMKLLYTEKEMIELKDEAQERKERMNELMITLEKTEKELTSRIRNTENERDNLAIQLSENKIHAQKFIERLTIELNDSRTNIRTLEDKLGRGIEENELLYKKLREIGSASPSSICGLNRLKMKRMNSLSDLTNLNYIDPYCLERDILAEEYNELKSRFEKAVNEIKAMKKELKDTQNQYDTLEIEHASLRQDYERRKIEDESQLEMMAARIQDLTLKYSAAERQVRNLKSKLVKSEKRRSLSLKGRESLSLPKELEEKVIELETKIDAIDPILITNRESSKFSLNLDERNLKRTSARLRRKSLDSSSTESMQILLRLNTLEKWVDSANNTQQQQHENSYSNNNNNNSSPKLSEHLVERLKCLEGVVIASKDRIEQSLQQLQSLKLASRARRSVSPIITTTTIDKKDSLRFVERCLIDALKILRDSCDNCITYDCDTPARANNNSVMILPETNPIKLSLQQLEIQLNNKLSELLKQRRMLRERNELTTHKDLELLAERVAFESVCFGKLRDAIQRTENPIEFNEKQTRTEMAETTQLISLLRAKLSGKCTIQPNGSLDILASILARRLVLTAGRTTGQFKLPELTPININVMDELLRQQNELNLVTMRFKNNAMETLASGLAAETLSYITANDAVQGAAQEAWRQAQEAVNAELVQSEIAHIMMRNAKRFENTITPSFGYTLTYQERISFENFSDAVQDALRKEMDVAINQLTCCYEESIIKMKRGQWRLHLEQERKASEGRQLLSEFADIVAHKALIDARINVLKGEYHPKELQTSKDNFYSITSLQKYENLFTELATDLEITNPADILAEADFNFMYKYFTTDFSTNKNEIKELTNSLSKLEQSISLLERTLTPNNIKTATTIPFDNVENLLCVRNKNNELKLRVDSLITTAQQQLQLPCDECDKIQKILQNISNHHEIELEELRKIHEDNLDVVSNELENQKKYTKCLEIEKYEITNEIENERRKNENHLEVLIKLNEKLNDYEKLNHSKELETNDLIESLDEEREKSKVFVKSINELSSKCEKYSDDYYQVIKERDHILEQIEKERERIRKLEKHLEFLETEHLQQMEHLQATYKQNNDADDQVQRIADEETLRERYQAEIEHLRMLCEKGLAAMESSHRRIINELEEKHRTETQDLLSDKEQALAEETQATLAALDAMRKAHQNEVQREVTRFKQEFVKQFQLGGQTLSGAKGKEQDLEEIRLEILSLSEKYSFKCVEAASLEEKLKSTLQQVKQSQQTINQLEKRNKQLRAHLISDDVEGSGNGCSSSKETTNPKNIVHDDDNYRNASTLKENNSKNEIHPRLKLVKEMKMSTVDNSKIVYTPVYNPSSLLTATNSTSSKIVTGKTLHLNRDCDRNHNIIVVNDLIKQTSANINKLCSPPPLNVKDVEHLQKFELEI